MTRDLFISLTLLALAARAAPAQERVSLVVDAGSHLTRVGGLHFTSDSRHLISTSRDSLRVHDVATGRAERVVRLPGRAGVQSALSGDGKTLAVAGDSPQGGGKAVLHFVYLLSVPALRLERSIPVGERVTHVALSGDGGRLAVGMADNAWQVFDAKTGKAAGKLVKLKQPIAGLALSPDGGRVAVAREGDPPAGEVIDLSDGRNAFDFQGRAAAWSPDGKTFAAAGRGLRLFGPDGKQRHLLPLAESKKPEQSRTSFESVAFSADSKSVLATWQSEKIEAGATLFDVATGKDLARLAPKAVFGSVGSGRCALSPDGRFAATAASLSTSHEVILWRLEGSGGKAARPERAVEHRRLNRSPWLTSESQAAWRSDGKAVSWLSGGQVEWSPHGAAKSWPERLRAPAFDLDRLEPGPPLTQEGARGLVQKRGGHLLTWQGDALKLLKDDKAAATVGKKEPHRQVATLVGTEHVVMGPPWQSFEIATGKTARASRGPLSVAPSPDARFLLRLDLGQVLQVVPARLPFGRPLLNLLVSGRDWVAWTPGGYYTGTPGGERMVSCRVENGPDAMPDVYSLDRFRKRLYRPDVISKAFELGSVKAALEALDGRGAEVTEVEKILPPKATLKVVGQKDGEVTVEVEAKGQAKGQPVTGLRLMLDGRPLGDDEARPLDAEKKRWAVKLPGGGEHRLDVLARGADSSSRSEAVTVVGKGKAKRPSLHVLAIGIDQYGGGVHKLQAAVRDAKDVAKAFEKAADKGDLFDGVKVALLTDEKATVKGITGGLAALHVQAKREDVVVIFFAGHGMRQDGQLYLLTSESRLEGKALDVKTALSGKGLAKQLGRVKGHVLLLLDACHPGAMAERFRGGSDDAARAFADDEVGVVVLAATMGKQQALEEKGGNGLFAAAIKEALQPRDGKLPPFNEADGRMDVRHLYSFVIDRVDERSAGRQTPFLLLPPGVSPFALRQFAVPVPKK
jgi:WD40 repeat protein